MAFEKIEAGGGVVGVNVGVFIGAGADHGQILLGDSKHGSAPGFVNKS